MNIRFFAPEGQCRAREELERILRFGEDQLAVACAFVSSAGVSILKPYARRLGGSDSFLVVSGDPPTDLEALADLHALYPGTVFVHFGASLPREIKVGFPLMHSKVFYARRGDQCLLWVGSHNLTASATQAINYEAAVILEGVSSEPPFVDALRHLMDCRNSAIPYDPIMAGRNKGSSSRHTLVIYAETSETNIPLDFHVHLRLPDPSLDDILGPPADVVLYLFPFGALSSETAMQKDAAPYYGVLTALNFTEQHPNTPGIPAEWQLADFVIDLRSDGIPEFRKACPAERTVTTQSVFGIMRQAPQFSLSSALWLESSPTEKLARIPSETKTIQLDEDMKPFFYRDSLSADGVLYQPIGHVKRRAEVAYDAIRGHNWNDLGARLQRESDRTYELVEGRRAPRGRQRRLIFRAKYRV